MTAGLMLYRTLMQTLSPFVPIVFSHRLKKGKELPGRLHERQARTLPARPTGTLIWMHGASIGESKLLLGLSAAMRADHPNAHFLFTSQTASSAQIINASLPINAHHQMLPFDTPSAAQRFIAHWSPDLCIFAEGELWPNLLTASHKHGCKTALINARMTAKSLKNWQRAPKSARKLLGYFDEILAADTRTAEGLKKLSGRAVGNIGNLKIGLAARDISRNTKICPTAPRFSETDNVLLGASTHEGEEQLLLAALDSLPSTTKLILAPRHPTRADDIETLIKATGRTYTRRSQNHPLTQETQILLADTFGEMPLWYQAASAVYLGGGHRPGIGGHTPLEPISYFLPILTGPCTDNFADTYKAIKPHNWVQIVHTSDQIAAALPSLAPLSPATVSAFLATGSQALTHTRTMLSALLTRKHAV